MKLDHFANRVHEDFFERIVELFTDQLGCVEGIRHPGAIWLSQGDCPIRIQLSRSTTADRDEDKPKSQIAFRSSEPRQTLERLSLWLQERGVRSTVGAYNATDHYLDAPDAFIDFVIEAIPPKRS